MALKTLSITVRVGETVSVSGPASLKVEHESGNRVRLAVMADESVKIERSPAMTTGAVMAQKGTQPTLRPTQGER